MGKNALAIIIIILTVAVLATAGYLYYQKITLEKIPNEVNSEKIIEPASNAISSADKLPVTDNPEEMSLPIDPGRIPANPGREPVKSNPDSTKKKETPLSANMDSSAWSSYKNKKYGYSFKYPAEFDFRKCTDENPCKFGQVYEQGGGDLAYLSAQTNQRGWPYVTVAHYDSDSFALPPNQKLIDWFKGKFQGDAVPKDYNYEIKTLKGNPKKAIRISFSRTPQAYAKEEIYFADGNKVFQIQLLDTSESEAWNFYGPWLESFIWEEK